jgi:hypothetical protein
MLLHCLLVGVLILVTRTIYTFWIIFMYLHQPVLLNSARSLVHYLNQRYTLYSGISLVRGL